MAELKIKALGLVQVDNETAKKIEKLKEDPKISPSTWIRAGKWSGSLGEIAGVFITPENNSSKKDEDYRKTNEEFIQERKKILALSPEVRAKRFAMFNLLYSCVTENWGLPPKEILDEAYEVQKMFFEDNPGRCYCEPILFQEILVPVAKSRIYKVGLRGVGVIENMVMTDKYYSKRKM